MSRGSGEGRASAALRGPPAPRARPRLSSVLQGVRSGCARPGKPRATAADRPPRGGGWGYADLLKIIRNPKHKERESMLEWLGGPFDPEAFDLNKTNRFLRKLKWPHVTEGQVAAVLMQRDGVGK